MTFFVSDLRYAVRSLLARPLLTAVMVLTLAFGIGANTAIFSLYEQVALRPLPVQAPERLVNLSSPGPKSGWQSSGDAGGPDEIFSLPMIRDLQQAPLPFEGVAAHAGFGANLAAEAGTEVGQGSYVTGNYFEVLGVHAELGRLLVPSDDLSGGQGRVVVLDHAYWRNALGGDPGIVGRTLRVNGEALTVVGVAPATFRGTTFGQRPDVYVPVSLRWTLEPNTPYDHHERNAYWLYPFARLADGVDVARAEQALDAVHSRILGEVEAPLQGYDDPARLQAFVERHATLSPGSHGRRPEGAATPLLMLGAATGVVLLIGCLNIANLLLARGAARAGEMAVRASLGASRARLVRQSLAEAVVIAVVGVVASLPVALATAHGIAWLAQEGLGDVLDVGFDTTMLAGAAIIGAATALGFGLVPALASARGAPIAALRNDGTRAVGGRGAARFRAVLASLQIGLSMVALVLAGLFVQTLHNLSQVDLGLDTGAVVTFTVSPARNGYEFERAARLYDRLESELRALPGVASATSSLVPLLSGNRYSSNIAVGEHDSDSAAPDTYYNRVGDDFFRTLDIDLLAGRTFEPADRDGAPQVAVVNRRFVELYGLGDSPVGQTMSVGGGERAIEIVGVVADIRYAAVRDAMPALFYLPRRQWGDDGNMSFYVRAAGDTAPLLTAIPALVAGLDPDLPVENLRTLPQQVDRMLALERFVGTLSAAFALLATLLAALGLYGVLSYTLAQRTRELGLRLALGAAPARLRRLVLGQVGRLAIAGVALGLVCAIALGRAAGSLLYGLEGHDPTVLAAATALLLGVALLAAWVPARRAARIDPMSALRHE